MSLKQNIIANYVSQFYVTLTGIVMLPVYIKYLGAEAYGLVGFFAMLQAWFQLLDMGLTPTMARQTARYQGGAINAESLRRLLRVLEGIFVGVALLGALSIIAAAELIATRWLNVQILPLSEVRNAVMLMGIIVALRWTCGLYRGAISGFEKLVWLGGWNSFIATLRFVLVIPFFIFVGTSPTAFFLYQLGVAIVELLVLITQSYRLLPKIEVGHNTPWQWLPLQRVLKFSLSIAFTSSVWVLVTQTDKLVLSKLLPLTDYGYFTLAVLVAGGVLMVSGPVSGAIMPRMTRLQASGDEVGLIQLYRNATQLVTVIAMPTALVLAFFSEQVLWAWTGDTMLATKAAPVLALYAIGNGILVVAAFQYYLQFAKGEMKLHLIGNALFVLVLIPSLILTTWQFGMVGAGWVWLISNGVALFMWVPVVHRRFARGLHWPWLARDVGLITLIAVIATGLSSWVISWSGNRVAVAFQLAGMAMLALTLSSLGSNWIRESALRRWFSYRAA
jgi:O-antigen/teichoic acid export membrane protein